MQVNAPRLTLGIPHLDRVDSLRKAIDSALAQTVPARVLVADQGGTDATLELMEQYKEHPLVSHHITKGHARCLQENWRLCLEACQTEFFAWLQDDDVIAPHLAKRVISAFDQWPTANVWCACLGVSRYGASIDLANWWERTGPMVPMDLLRGSTNIWPAVYLLAGGFFHSFALSPGMAFRSNESAIDAVRRVPIDCDLYAERLVLAELVGQGGWIADPAFVGIWRQHEQNESKKQNARLEDKLRQRVKAFAQLARLLEQHPGWQDMFSGWCHMISAEQARVWLDDLKTLPEADRPVALSEAINLMLACHPGADAVALPPQPRNGQHETTEARLPRRAEKAIRKGR